MSIQRASILCIALATLLVTGSVSGQLIHHWDLDDEQGLEAVDRAACGSTGALVGFDNLDDLHWVEGIYGSGLDLGSDGIFDNRVQQNLSPAGTGDGGFTVTMWINPGDAILNAGEYQLLATPGDVVGFTIMNYVNGPIHDRVLLFWDGNLPNLHVGTTTLEPGTWYHVAITSGGPGGEKRYYLDGELEAQTLFLPAQGGTEGSHPVNNASWGAGAGAIGALAGGQRGHDSILDDVRIYDGELTLEEIQAAMDDEPSPLPEISNITPLAGTADHNPAEGLAFDVAAIAAGTTISADAIGLTLNGEDVSDQLSIAGNETAHEVIYEGLVENLSYTAVITVTDSAGQTRCAEFSFGTIVETVPGLVHLFNLDETDGLNAADLGSARNGTLNNFDTAVSNPWEEAICDGGLNFGHDGTANNFVTFNSREVSALENGGLTVSMWIKPGPEILIPGEYQLLSTPGDAIGFSIMNDSREVFHDRVLLFWDGNISSLHVGTTTLEPGVWYHVAITSAGVEGEKLYYVNGELEEQALFWPAQGGIDGEHFGTRDGWLEGIASIGALPNGTRAHGSVFDDVRIYNRALDDQEVFDVMQECDPVLCQPLELSDLSPADGEVFSQGVDTLEMEIASPNAGDGIQADTVSLSTLR